VLLCSNPYHANNDSNWEHPVKKWEEITNVLKNWSNYVGLASATKARTKNVVDTERQKWLNDNLVAGYRSLLKGERVIIYLPTTKAGTTYEATDQTKKVDEPCSRKNQRSNDFHLRNWKSGKMHWREQVNVLSQALLLFAEKLQFIWIYFILEAIAIAHTDLHLILEKA
jgi:hypothetical protein